MVNELEDFIKSELGSGSLDTPESIKAVVVEVLEQIHRYKEGIRKYIEDNYVDFMPHHSTFDSYIEEGEHLLRESEHLLNNVGSDARMALNKANVDLVQFVNQLQEATLGLKVSQRILTIDDLLKSIEKANAAKDYLLILDLMTKLKSLICNDATTDVDRIFQMCDCYNAIKVKYHIEENILKQNLQQRFENLLQLQEKTFPNAKNIKILVSKDVTQLQDTAVALFQARYNPLRICDFLWENCLMPIITKPVSIEFSDTQPDYVQLNISYSLKDLTSKSLKPSYKQVFAHTNQLFDCLANINVNVNTDQYVFTIIGNYLKERFIEALITECLLDAIPDTMDEYQQSTLIQDLLHFEQSLADHFFIDPEKDTGLREFTTKFDRLFCNRFNEKILQSSREIMQKDLQDMTVVSEGNRSEDVSKNAFLFPQCMVSKSTLDLIKLMERILKQPNNIECSVEEVVDDEAVEPLSVIPTILNTYVSVVPKLHKKLLESIPQQSVLFYNNCMFLAHWIVQKGNVAIPTHTSLVKTLQSTGQHHFKTQISQQQKIITDILRDFDISDPHSLGTGPLKLIQQCLRQMDLLKNVWLNVLPDAVYNRTFCDLLNYFCQDIIKRILNLEDISTTVANELSDILEVILQKAANLFKDAHEVLHIPCWMKLQQLKMMLNASLQEIIEHWCGGAGILTANYKAEEVRHLIRALFQNTDRRAYALSKII